MPTKEIKQEQEEQQSGDLTPPSGSGKDTTETMNRWDDLDLTTGDAYSTKGTSFEREICEGFKENSAKFRDPWLFAFPDKSRLSPSLDQHNHLFTSSTRLVLSYAVRMTDSTHR